MLDSSTNITFLFNSGRKKRISEDNEFPKEHFYGYFNFKNNFKNTKFIEYAEDKNKFSLTTKILRKITKFPIFTEKIINKKNKKIINKSDILIFSNQNIYYSVFPYLLFSKKNKKIIVFFMGYKNIINEKSDFNKIQLFFFTYILKKIDRIVFLSENELNLFSKEFSAFSYKTSYLPFVVDKIFWSKKEDRVDNNAVLFIGNDENRDYKKTIQIVNSMEDINFIIVSSKIDKSMLHKNNFQLINSNWKLNKFSDSELKQLMEKAAISIIPIKKETTQPSGQSVALQCLAMEIPVIISDFKGFWDRKLFQHKENIYILENNSQNSWENNIQLVLNDEKLKKTISENGRKLIETKFNLEIFYNHLLEIIN